VSKTNWKTEGLEDQLNELVAAEPLNTKGELSLVSLAKVAMELDIPKRNVAAKLRKSGTKVETLNKVSDWNEAETKALGDYLTANNGVFSPEQVAQKLYGTKFSAAQVRGKALSMDKASFFRKVEPKAAVLKYTEAEEAKIVSLANAGKNIEDIAIALDRSTQSIRGKCLSLYTKGLVTSIPKSSQVVKVVDVLDGLDGVAISKMSIADLSNHTGKSETGMKTILTRRGISCSNWDGAKKRAKADEKAAA